MGESGAAFLRRGLPFDPLSAREEKDAKVVKEKLGVSTLAELRRLPAEKLLETFSPPKSPGFDFGPCVDGYFLPDSLNNIFSAGKQNDVPLLAGWNRDEGSFEITYAPQKPTAESVKASAEKEFGDKAAEFLKLYPTDDEHLTRSALDFAGDRFIAFTTWKWIELQSTTGHQPVYRYRFDRGIPDTDPKAPTYANHSAEIEYVFGQLDSKAGIPWTAADRALSELMMKYWSNFARSGDPNGPGLPEWPKYLSTDGWPVMFLNVQSAAHKDDLRDRYLFLNSQWMK
jgi:para-nitrobenzyl esterase